MLTIKEVTDERFPEKLKNVQKKINKAFFKKYKNNINNFGEYKFLIFSMISSFLLIFSLTIGMLLFIINIGIISIITFLLYCQEKKKEETIKKIKNRVNIKELVLAKEYEGYHLNENKLLNIVKSLNKKELDIVKGINKNKSLKEIDALAFAILFQKIEKSSLEEIELEKEYIDNYIEKNKNNENGIKIEYLLKMKELKEKKIKNNNIVNMI